MQINSPYKKRPIRFLRIIQHKDWKIKLYSISLYNEFVSNENIEVSISNLDNWLSKCETNQLKTYSMATLILHEGKEGCFAIINWWIDENMLQNFVYLKNEHGKFNVFCNNEIPTCIWELAVIWHERNAWIKHILMKNENPDIEAYLNDQLNQDT